MHVMEAHETRRAEESAGNVTTIRLPADLRAELQRRADGADRPLSWVIRKALTEYVAEQEAA